jgi:SH3-like domain-containing protein
MSNVFIGYAQVAATGARLASGVASANAAIPNNSAGNLPRFVRITATAAAHIRFGPATPVAVNTDVMVQPGDPLVLVVAGNTNFAVIQETAAGVVIVTPLENS